MIITIVHNFTKERMDKRFVKKQMEDDRLGNNYESGLALSIAHSGVKANKTKQNPEGAPRNKLKCAYHHPRYCMLLGHIICANKSCLMKGKSTYYLSLIRKDIEREVVKNQMRLDMDTSSEYC